MTLQEFLPLAEAFIKKFGEDWTRLMEANPRAYLKKMEDYEWWEEVLGHYYYETFPKEDQT